jgi:fatty-acyl-CoA synthase
VTLAGAARQSRRVMNLGDLLTQTARRLPAHPGLIVGERVLTWRELNARADAAAHALATLGVSKGDRVLVHARNSADMWETLWASFKLGAVWVPTNFRIHPNDIDHIAAHSGARVLIYDDAFPEHADHALANGVEIAICIGTPRAGELSWPGLVEAELGNPFPAAPVEYDDPCWFFFTSGTTGKPKAAVLSHGQMAFVTANHLADLMPGMTESDASLVVAPLSHGAGINQLILTARGVPTILTTGARFDPEAVFGLIERHKVSNMFTVPTILHALAGHPAADKYDHSSLRYVIYAGAPMLRDHQKLALSKLGNCIVQYFGLGEVTGNITVLPPHQHSLDDAVMRVGSCGYARTGMEIEIQGDEGHALPAGEVGEICVIGPAVFNGYYNNEKANAEAFRDGWFRTGDLGYLDENGYLYITGRASDMYISGGSNIYPLEIEEKIARHPAVAEAAVFGMADEKWGEIGVAAVSLKPGASLTYEALDTFLRPLMASYKLPRRLVLFDELPKSGYGKITKKMLRAAVEARDAGGA